MKNILSILIGMLIAITLTLIAFVSVEIRGINKDVVEIKSEVSEIKQEQRVQEKVLEIVVDSIPELSIEEQTEKASKKWKVDYKVLRAIIKVESKDDPEAIGHNSGSFDYGYCQVNLSNKQMLYEKFGLNCHNKDENIECGAILLKGAIQKADKYADGDIRFALIVYNQGFKSALEMWNSGIHETNYTKKVLEKMKYV